MIVRSALVDYSLILNSYYSLSDIYGSAGDDPEEPDCTVGSDATPCLCRADPDTGRENTTTDLYGEGFDVLVDGSGSEIVTFVGSTSRLDTDGSESWIRGVCSDLVSASEATCVTAGETWVADATAATDAIVPDGAISDDDGVRVENDTLASNTLAFSVSCGSNLDCATGCCSSVGQCATAGTCNACENTTDCTYAGCASECVAGMCAPYINDVSPLAGAVGQPVTIQGCHFGTYYDPDSYPLGSQVTVDGIPAELACNEVDSWNNLQIATMPDGILDDSTTTTADVVVTQAYSSGTATQTSNAFALPETRVVPKWIYRCYVMLLPTTVRLLPLMI